MALPPNFFNLYQDQLLDQRKRMEMYETYRAQQLRNGNILPPYQLIQNGPSNCQAPFGNGSMMDMSTNRFDPSSGNMWRVYDRSSQSFERFPTQGITTDRQFSGLPMNCGPYHPNNYMTMSRNQQPGFPLIPQQPPVVTPGRYVNTPGISSVTSPNRMFSPQTTPRLYNTTVPQPGLDPNKSPLYHTNQNVTSLSPKDLQNKTLEKTQKPNVASYSYTDHWTVQKSNEILNKSASGKDFQKVALKNTNSLVVNPGRINDKFTEESNYPLISDCDCNSKDGCKKCTARAHIAKHNKLEHDKMVAVELKVYNKVETSEKKSLCCDPKPKAKLQSVWDVEDENETLTSTKLPDKRNDSVNTKGNLMGKDSAEAGSGRVDMSAEASDVADVAALMQKMGLGPPYQLPIGLAPRHVLPYLTWMKQREMIDKSAEKNEVNQLINTQPMCESNLNLASDANKNPKGPEVVQTSGNPVLSNNLNAIPVMAPSTPSPYSSVQMFNPTPSYMLPYNPEATKLALHLLQQEQLLLQAYSLQACMMNQATLAQAIAQGGSRSSTATAMNQSNPISESDNSQVETMLKNLYSNDFDTEQANPHTMLDAVNRSVGNFGLQSVPEKRKGLQYLSTSDSSSNSRSDEIHVEPNYKCELYSEVDVLDDDQIESILKKLHFVPEEEKWDEGVGTCCDLNIPCSLQNNSKSADITEQHKSHVLPIVSEKPQVSHIFEDESECIAVDGKVKLFSPLRKPKTLIKCLQPIKKPH
ncbi:uncharacterized protein LOC131940785 [Physella acuta]|uniref:uncharacterized protein LOC131940785 n=1 Tax=Physella acuta TaxID=109671 RepID=UPI0027DE54C4|nr:uncharacterized protein LOC131940785 [Physella acuta]XP_059155578.1 uncharacterized protein LOC131940785 [Physella acuta]